MMSAVDQVISAQPESGEKTTLTADTDAGGYQPLGLKDLTKTNVLRVHQYLDVLEGITKIPGQCIVRGIVY